MPGYVTILEDWNDELHKLVDDLQAEQKQYKRTWQTDWPTEEGHWWFYGSRWNNDPVSMHFVTLWIRGDGISYATDIGGYVFNKAKGKWQKVFVPKLPKEKA